MEVNVVRFHKWLRATSNLVDAALAIRGIPVIDYDATEIDNVLIWNLRNAVKLLEKTQKNMGSESQKQSIPK